MVEVVFNGRSISVPQCVDELDTEKYKAFICLGMLADMMGYDFYRMRAEWFLTLVDSPCDLALLKSELQEEALSQLEAVDGFFHIGQDGEPHINRDTVRNLWPQYQGHNGPGDWLEGMTFGEFMECMAVISTMEEADAEEGVEACRHLARVLYRMEETEFVDSMFAAHCVGLFMYVWNAIGRAPVPVAGREIDFRIIFRTSGEARPDDRTGWAGIAFEVASSGVFGDLKGVEGADFWSVLLYLYKCKFEYLHDKSNQN